jgi:hypothetical protein
MAASDAGAPASEAAPAAAASGASQ